MLLEIGQVAPAFSLYNTEKELISLEDFKGRNVLLLFFPLAFTSVCTAELCSINDSIALYTNAKAEVLSISVDSLFTLGTFKKAENLNFSLLSDFNKDASLAYGTLYDTFAYGMKGVSKRSAFIVDKEGKIAYAEVLENASEQPTYGDIKAVLQRLSKQKI